MIILSYSIIFSYSIISQISKTLMIKISRYTIMVDHFYNIDNNKGNNIKNNKIAIYSNNL